MFGFHVWQNILEHLATVDFSMRNQFHVGTCSKDLIYNFALKYEINAVN